MNKLGTSARKELSGGARGTQVGRGSGVRLTAHPRQSPAGGYACSGPVGGAASSATDCQPGGRGTQHLPSSH